MIQFPKFNRRMKLTEQISNSISSNSTQEKESMPNEQDNTNFDNISQEKSKQQDENKQILSKNPKLIQTISLSKPRNINDSDILSIENKLYSLRNKIKKHDNNEVETQIDFQRQNQLTEISNNMNKKKLVFNKKRNKSTNIVNYTDIESTPNSDGNLQVSETLNQNESENEERYVVTQKDKIILFLLIVIILIIIGFGVPFVYLF